MSVTTGLFYAFSAVLLFAAMAVKYAYWMRLVKLKSTQLTTYGLVVC